MRQSVLSAYLACGALLLSACVPYKPTLHLDPSPVTIPAKILVQPLLDQSPTEDRQHSTWHSFSQTSEDSLDGDLATLVTRAITADFSATSVFKSVAAAERNPDLILSGTIHRFYGEVILPSWTMIPGVAWAVSAFWSPVQERHGSVDIELTLAAPGGGVAGRYRGCDIYTEFASHERAYWSMPIYPAHSRLNRSFTDVLQQIRDQMLDDRSRLLAAMQAPAPQTAGLPPVSLTADPATCTPRVRPESTDQLRARRSSSSHH